MEQFFPPVLLLLIFASQIKTIKCLFHQQEIGEKLEATLRSVGKGTESEIYEA